MDTFRSYLTQTQQTVSAFARRIGKSPNYVSEIASGKRVPSLRVAYDIWLHSGGVVPMQHWIDPSSVGSTKGSSTSHRATPKSTPNICEENNA